MMVSAESDELIVVDSEDRDIGSLSKLLCHQVLLAMWRRQ